MRHKYCLTQSWNLLDVYFSVLFDMSLYLVVKGYTLELTCRKESNDQVNKNSQSQISILNINKLRTFDCCGPPVFIEH